MKFDIHLNTRASRSSCASQIFEPICCCHSCRCRCRCRRFHQPCSYPSSQFRISVEKFWCEVTGDNPSFTSQEHWQWNVESRNWYWTRPRPGVLDSFEYSRLSTYIILQALTGFTNTFAISARHLCCWMISKKSLLGLFSEESGVHSVIFAPYVHSSENFSCAGHSKNVLKRRS